MIENCEVEYLSATISFAAGFVAGGIVVLVWCYLIYLLIKNHNYENDNK
jgi:TRAP-type C4-dicarboxylate transport system permease large subunit